MGNHSVRPTDDELENVVNNYFNMLFRLCFTILGNSADAEDAVSEVFLKYISKPTAFNGEEHRKAWLIRVATNVCRNMRRRPAFCNIDDFEQLAAEERDRTVLEEVMRLPEKYRTVIYLHYIEGYRVAEIGAMLRISPSAAKKRLQYARQRLRIEYEKEGHI